MLKKRESLWVFFLSKMVLLKHEIKNSTPIQNFVAEIAFSRQQKWQH
jgi:hypothetical protein